MANIEITEPIGADQQVYVDEDGESFIRGGVGRIYLVPDPRGFAVRLIIQGPIESSGGG